MLQAVGLSMHLVPGITQRFMQKELQQTVVADDLQGHLFSLVGQLDATVFPVFQQGGFVRRQPFEHPGDRGGRHPHSLCDPVRGRPFLNLGELIDRFQIIFDCVG
jgi:hypothetical protein